MPAKSPAPLAKFMGHGEARAGPAMTWMSGQGKVDSWGVSWGTPKNGWFITTNG